MAHIFKFPKPAQKGIVVFTHKEEDWFETTPVCREAIEVIRRQYLIGVHYGWCLERRRAWFQDFALARPTMVTFADDEPFRIPMNSVEFASRDFRPEPEVPKFWDIVFVSRNARFKRPDAFLAAIREIYDRGLPWRVLFVCIADETETPERNMVELVETYKRAFSFSERQDFTLMRLGKDLGLLGIPHRTLAHLYRSSKIYCHLAEVEGASKTLHEALLCGLGIVAYAGLRGGGLDYLDPSNSVLFSDYSGLADALIDAVMRHDRLNSKPEQYVDAFREDTSLVRLARYFDELYAAHGMRFDGELVNTDALAFRLPAHYEDVPWGGDLRSIEQFQTFIDHLEWCE